MYSVVGSVADLYSVAVVVGPVAVVVGPVAVVVGPVAVVVAAAEQTVVAFAVAIPVVAEPFPAGEHDPHHMEGDLGCESACWFSMRELLIILCLTV